MREKKRLKKRLLDNDRQKGRVWGLSESKSKMKQGLRLVAVPHKAWNATKLFFCSQRLFTKTKWKVNHVKREESSSKKSEKPEPKKKCKQTLFTNHHVISVHACDLGALWNGYLSFHLLQHYLQTLPVHAQAPPCKKCTVQQDIGMLSSSTVRQILAEKQWWKWKMGAHYCPRNRAGVTNKELSLISWQPQNQKQSTSYDGQLRATSSGHPSSPASEAVSVAFVANVRTRWVGGCCFFR